MDILLPPWLNIAAIEWRYLERGGASLPQFGGPVRTASLGGDRLGAALEFTPTGTSTSTQLRDRRVGQAFRSRLRGRQNRAYLTNPARRTDYGFPGSELVSDNTFASGSLSSYTQGSEYTGAVQDRSARLVRTADTGSARALYRTTSQLAAITSGLPYIFRAFVYSGRGPATDQLELRAGSSNGGAEYGSASFTGPGMLSLPFVSLGTAISITLLEKASAHAIADDYMDCPYFSLARCAMADIGANLFIHSDDLTQSVWNKTRSTISASSVALPDGTTGTVNMLAEDNSAATSHLVDQDVTVTADVQDICLVWALKATSNRNWARVSMVESIGSLAASAFINLTTGALGTVSGVTNWANARAEVRDLGGGWYEISLVATKLNGSLTITGRLTVAEADGDVTFNGLTQNSIAFQWPTIAPSPIPIRRISTGAVALADGSPNASEIYALGLTASSAGQLLPGHEFEVITSYGSEIKIVEAPLDGDGQGRGLLQFSPPLRGSIVNGSPIIIHEPFAYVMSASDSIATKYEPGLATASIEIEEGV